MFKGNKEVEKALYALGEQLEAEGVERLEIVVCGAAALFNLLWHAEDRTTMDVDILAFVAEDKEGLKTLQPDTPLWSKVKDAVRRVARDFDLEENWLNRGAVFIVNMGLPAGLIERVNPHKFGKNLIVDFVGRQDLISLKLYAYLDDTRRPDVHFDDLFELEPTDEEMEEAARWCAKIDSSAGFKESLKEGLNRLNYRDVAERL